MGVVSEILEKERLSHAEKTSESHKKALGQYLTPYSIAKFMASLFPAADKEMNILAPGAGIGTLSCALLDRSKVEKWNNPKINVTAYDLDKTVLNSLSDNLVASGKEIQIFSYQILNEDFLEKTSFEYSFGTNEQFTHVIMNPPYKKILSKSPARAIQISPGKHSELIKQIIEEMAPRFLPGSILVYIGDTGEKWGYYDQEIAGNLLFNVKEHGKMPDVILFVKDKNWLVLVESVTSHGPVDSKRYIELEELFGSVTADKVYISAFPDKFTFVRFANDIAWETEAWIADNPDHMIHFNGDKFLGPHK